MSQSQAHDPLIGREVKDYRFTDKLGGGAFGAVYRAEHIRLSGRSVAIKVLHPHIASDEGIVERFRREARSLSGLNHPNIVQIIDFDWNDDVGFYLVLEWLKGDALNTILKKKKRLPVDVVIDLFSQMLSGLQEAHEQGIVHRDLKPANVMVMETGPRRILKLLDFGIASLSDSEHDLTSDGTAMGSANYMSPEQALGQIKKIDNRSDLYSCGIIMGKCLTGKNVYAADSPTQILWKHIYEPPPLLKSLYPEGNFSQALEDVFAKAIAKDKEDRFQSATEFLAALQKAASNAEEVELVDDNFIDDADATIFEPDYNTGNLLQHEPPRVTQTPIPKMTRTAQQSEDFSSAAPVVTGQAVVSGGGSPQRASGSQFVRGGAVAVAQPQVAARPVATTGSPAVARVSSSTGGHARAAVARPVSSVAGHEGRQPGVHTLSREELSSSRAVVTGMSRAFGHDVGDSSASFERPAHRSVTRTRGSVSPIRSPMLQPPEEPSFWEKYKWWVIGGLVGSLIVVGSIFTVVTLLRPAPKKKPAKIDTDYKKANEFFDKIDKSMKKEKKK